MARFGRTLLLFGFVTILLLLPFARADQQENSIDQRVLLTYIERTLRSVEKALRYINEHITKLNVDGLIGVRETENKFASIVSYHWVYLPHHITRKLRNLVDFARNVGDESEAIVKKSTPKYYAVVAPLVKEHFWDLMFPDRPINISLIRMTPHNQEIEYNEAQGDFCLSELYGTSGNVACSISPLCWKRMTGKNYKDYALTHNVFYILNGIHANCQAELEDAALKYEGKTLVQLMDFFCANVYSEALAIAKQGFPYEDADLLMEQIGLCGDAGYMEIAKWKWLPRILSWQRPAGCFGILPGEKVNPLNFDPNGYGKNKRSITIRKRVEQKMSKDGCLSHRISVALSALVTYARRLIQEYVHVRN